MKKKIITSFVLVLAMIMQMLTFATVSNAQETQNIGTTDGINWFELAKSKGCYIEAGDSGSATGMALHDINRLYDLSDATDAEDFDKLATGNSAASLVTAGKTYVADLNNDSAVKHTIISSSDNTEKIVWMTTKNYKNRGNGSTSGGYTYFKTTNDTILKSDKKIYVILEYLESGSSELNIDYVTNIGNSADGGTAKKTPSFKRKGTNKWVTAVIQIDDACC